MCILGFPYSWHEEMLVTYPPTILVAARVSELRPHVPELYVLIPTGSTPPLHEEGDGFAGGGGARAGGAVGVGDAGVGSAIAASNYVCMFKFV